MNLLCLGLPATGCLYAFFYMNIPGAWHYATLGLGIFFLGLGYCFYSLNIEVDVDEIRMSFGPGLIKKSWPISTCVAARQVRTSLIDGWGIKATKQGWLYSVNIPHAVLIRFENGKAVKLGTDEPEALLGALLEAGLELEDAD